MGDRVLKQQFALFQPQDLHRVEARRCGLSVDFFIEFPMFAAQFFKVLAQARLVLPNRLVHKRRPYFEVWPLDLGGQYLVGGEISTGGGLGAQGREQGCDGLTANKIGGRIDGIEQSLHIGHREPA